MVSVYGGMPHERKTRIWTMWQQGVASSTGRCNSLGKTFCSIFPLMNLMRKGRSRPYKPSVLNFVRFTA